jgi:1-acyl-sn-glycerol-3-phosphate acyltransferase
MIPDTHGAQPCLETIQAFSARPVRAQVAPRCPAPDSSLSIALTVPEAVSRLMGEPRLRRLVAAFSGSDAERILHLADDAQTERDFQATFGREFLRVLLARTANAVQYHVDERIGERLACLYISNHRDIVLDTALLNEALMAHGQPIPHVVLGANLLQTEWMVAFYRLCRAFVIRRDLSGKELYWQSRQVSDFVRSALERGEPVWMAQRPGRTKDGIDKTEPALLRMLFLSFERDFGKVRTDLHVTPVAVSYELEPCDAFKAATIIGARTKNESDDRARRDAANILRGLVQHKGRISLSIRPPIVIDTAELRSREPRRTDTISELATTVDREIAVGCTVWSTNYLAHDLLHECHAYAGCYTEEERDRFQAYVAWRATEILAPPADARRALLSLYATPVEPQRPGMGESAPARLSSLSPNGNALNGRIG